jgi:hypothetical protein
MNAVAEFAVAAIPWVFMGTGAAIGAVGAFGRADRSHSIAMACIALALLGAGALVACWTLPVTSQWLMD